MILVESMEELEEGINHQTTDFALVETANEVELNQLLDEAKTTEDGKSDHTRFGLTFRHLANRLMTANLSDHTLENTRKALAKTVAGTDNLGDIGFLRRDLNTGKRMLQIRLEKHPDPKERAEVKKHIAWLTSEYSKMLSDRAKELKK